MTYYINPPPANPVSRIIAALFAALAIAGAIFFGLIVLALAVGAGLLIWLVLWIRLRWLRHRHGANGWSPLDEVARPSGGETIEAEYTVIKKDSD